MQTVTTNKTIANSELPKQVETITYDPKKLKTRIVHLGFGAFHRAHQALYTHDVAQLSDSDWGICEVNLFTGKDPIRYLKEQDHLYTVCEKAAEKPLTNTEIAHVETAHVETAHTETTNTSETTRIQTKLIGVVTEGLHPVLDGVHTIIEKMAEPQVAIVSLTITEKGYCCDLNTGLLDGKNDLIIHDLKNPHRPKSAIGYLVQALKYRRDRALPPFTVLSCDNVQSNGHIAKTAVLNFAQQLEPELANWIEQNVPFPCTMVDRIVPAVTEEALGQIQNILGVKDPLGIACEPFRQWVIEDNFVTSNQGANNQGTSKHNKNESNNNESNKNKGRPDWDLAGAEFVKNVAPFEEMKLRMLNGSHSFLAYLGYLGGYQYIAETMENPNYRQAVLNLMLNEQAPTLSLPEGTDLEAYATSLIKRFSNLALKHKTWQIAMDGSQKIPQRMVPSIRFHLQQGTNYSHLAMGLAGWMRYVSGYDEQGNDIEVKDPMATQLKAIHTNNTNAKDIVVAFLSIKNIFGSDLVHNKHFITQLTEAYKVLQNTGAHGALAYLSNTKLINTKLSDTKKHASTETKEGCTE